MTQLACHTIAVLGAGTMGRGIAHVAALSGAHVWMYDISADVRKKAVLQIDKDLTTSVEKGKLSDDIKKATLAHLQTTTDLDTAVKNADLVIEAVPEKIELKQELLKKVSFLSNVVIGTNTSSLSISDIASASKNPSRVVGLHFFNPPHIMKLLEIVCAEQTSPETLDFAKAAGAQMQRDMIVVKDSPGFATSRLGLVLGLEAIRMLEQGVASAEDIDKAMELGYRHPMGPLRLTDIVGLDVRLAIADYLHKKLGNSFAPPELLKKMVREGKLGKKSGQGFYSW